MSGSAGAGEESEQFARRYPGYGYDGRIESLRKEVARLAGVTYLDHAGATLHTETQAKQVARFLESQLSANPHSRGPVSSRTFEQIEAVRERILSFFNTSSRYYSVVFTSGATAAIKLVGECFPWSAASRFVYTMDNHTSVLGVREYVHAANASAECLRVNSSRQLWGALAPSKTHEQDSPLEESSSLLYHLFAFPAESNFSGSLYDLSIVRHVQRFGVPPPEGQQIPTREQRWLVLLDAAKYVATHRLDLSDVQPDFVVLSFYKMFGYPTGLGALLVRHTKADGGSVNNCVLQKRYYGGGTVEGVLGDGRFHRLRRTISSRFEDGSVAFIDIPLLEYGFSCLERVGLTQSLVQRHVDSLTHYISTEMAQLRHSNGQPLCMLYGEQHQTTAGPIDNMGSILSFNLLRSSGQYVSPSSVEQLASACGIQLRSGCFCNPGACQLFLGLSEDDVRRSLDSGHVCWDDNDLLDNKPLGAVRVSLGYMSNFQDVATWLRFLRTYYLQRASEEEPTRAVCSASPIRLAGLAVFPIKSCGPMRVSCWPLGPYGFLYDREWALTTPEGRALSQKAVPSMVWITPEIDLAAGTIHVGFAGGQDRLVLPLADWNNQEQLVRVCGTEMAGQCYSGACNRWFSQKVGRDVSLVRRAPGAERKVGRSRKGHPSEATVAFANEGQFLLVNRSSVREVYRRWEQEHGAAESGSEVERVDAMVARFRPNLIVDGAEPFAEDKWSSLTIGQHQFDVIGPCFRCTMIDIDQSTSEADAGIFALLSRFKASGAKGKVSFGILLTRPPQSPSTSFELRVGDVVTPTVRLCTSALDC